MPVYRAYVVPGDAVPAEAAECSASHASARRSAHRSGRGARCPARPRPGPVGRSARKDEFVVRFQQTCGPVMAKGVEDTAFYRWYPPRRVCARSVATRRRAASDLPPSIGGRPPAGPLAYRDDDAVHARHQAVGGRAARLAVLSELAGEIGRGVPPFPGLGARTQGNDGTECRPRRSPTSSGRTSSEPGRSASTGWRRTSRRRCVRPSRRRPGRRSTRATSRGPGLAGHTPRRPVRSRTRSTAFVARLEPFARANSLSAKLIQLHHARCPGHLSRHRGHRPLARRP